VQAQAIISGNLTQPHSPSIIKSVVHATYDDPDALLQAGIAMPAPQAQEPRCLVSAFDGAYFSEREKGALWDKFFTGAHNDRGDPSSDTT
jgi:hypothetical protein